MSFNMRSCSCLLFPLCETLKGHDPLAVRRRVEASQWRPRVYLNAWRMQRLREFLGDGAVLGGVRAQKEAT